MGAPYLSYVPAALSSVEAAVPEVNHSTVVHVHVMPSKHTKEFTESYPRRPNFLIRHRTIAGGSSGKAETLRKDTGADNPQDDAFERGPVGRLHHRQAVHQPTHPARLEERLVFDVPRAQDILAEHR